VGSRPAQDTNWQHATGGYKTLPYKVIEISETRMVDTPQVGRASCPSSYAARYFRAQPPEPQRPPRTQRRMALSSNVLTPVISVAKVGAGLSPARGAYSSGRTGILPVVICGQAFWSTATRATETTKNTENKDSPIKRSHLSDLCDLCGKSRGGSQSRPPPTHAR
jgi:hypothetical protein